MDGGAVTETAGSPCPACDASGAPQAEEWRFRHAVARLCAECGLLFIDPQPSPAALAEYYGHGGGWQAARPPIHAQTAQTRTKQAAPELFAALDSYFPASRPQPGASVLDFGCGTGIWLNSFQDYRWRTFGIEPSSDVAFVRHQRLDHVPDTPTFDLVLAYHVLEHVPRPLDVLTQLAAALKPGGHLLVSVPRVDKVDIHGDRRYCLNERAHIVAFTQACLQNLMQRAGLSFTAALHELDEAFTKGRPLRLRLLAQKPQ